MSLLVPASVAAEQINAELERQADEHMAEAAHWTEELRRIDRSLGLVWVPPSAEDPELLPARWHIRKRIPGSVDAYIPLVGPENSYRPPGAWMLDWLTANDLWNPSVHRDKQEAKEKLREARRRAKALEGEQRRDEMELAARAALRLRDDRGLTKSSAAKREGKGLK